MDMWDQEAIDLVAPGFIEFGTNRIGEFGFIAVRGQMDCRQGERGERDRVEFSWQGDDDGDEVSGRGWAVLADDGSLQGHLYIHLGDDSGFRAVPFGRESADASSARRGR